MHESTNMVETALQALTLDPRPSIPSPPSGLPTELSDAIIDVIRDQDDFTTLRSCARVSKQWLPRSRSHLWHTIFIDNPRQLHSLRKVLEDTPEVRALVFVVVTNTQVYRARKWVIHDDAPPMIFPFLPKLQRWEIRHLQYHSILSSDDDSFGVPFSLTPTSLAALDQYTTIQEISIELKYSVFLEPQNLFRTLATLKSLKVLRIIPAPTDLPDDLLLPAMEVDFESASRLVELHVSLNIDYTLFIYSSDQFQACSLPPPLVTRLLEANAGTLRKVMIDCSALSDELGK